MFYAVNPIMLLIFPAVLIQYVAALFCLYKLVHLGLPKKQFWIWNFFILIIVGIGFISFLICYFCFKSTVFKNAEMFQSENKNPENKNVDICDSNEFIEDIKE